MEKLVWLLIPARCSFERCKLKENQNQKWNCWEKNPGTESGAEEKRHSKSKKYSGGNEGDQKAHEQHMDKRKPKKERKNWNEYFEFRGLEQKVWKLMSRCIIKKVPESGSGTTRSPQAGTQTPSVCACVERDRYRGVPAGWGFFFYFYLTESVLSSFSTGKHIEDDIQLDVWSYRTCMWYIIHERLVGSGRVK